MFLPKARKTSGISSLIKRKQARKISLPKSKTEDAYVRALRGVLDHVHASTMAFLEPKLADVARKDANVHSETLQFLFATIRTQLPEMVRRAFDKMAADVSKGNLVAIKQLVGVDGRTIGINHVIEAFRDQNIRLVEEAARAYAAQVREIFDTPTAHTLRVEELKAQLLERADVSKSRAELIARDQVLKLNGQITKTRQQAAGVSQYIWSTSKDARVRESHAALEGTTQDWAIAPEVGHPGEDIQCRCVPIPVVEELEGI